MIMIMIMIMRVNRFLMLGAMVLMGLAAWADQTNGEWAKNLDGTPAMQGQPTMDHLFVRSNVDGTMTDNSVTFNAEGYQFVWLWLDDDEIYQNTRVQALTPIPYNSAGDLYNEITYNSFECDLYLPEGVSLIRYEDDAEGEEYDYLQGDRMPTTSMFMYQELEQRKVIDGVTYRVYKLLCTSTAEYGCHFSARNPARYRANGALKKDDAPLLGLCLRLDDPASVMGELPNMIIANQEFGLREAYTVIPQWEPNDSRFIYGTGGNNESQRFQYYQRVRLFGNNDYELTETPVISYSLTSSAVVISATGHGDVVLMVNGEQVDNPCSIARGEEAVTVLVTATAQEPGKLVSETASMSITVPARPGVSGDNLLAMPAAVLAESGRPFDLPVALANSADISALQCDVFLPAGIELTGEGVSLVTSRVASSHSVSVRPLENGAWRVLIASPTAEAFNGNDGDLFVLHLNVAPEVIEGAYNVMLGNIVLADADAETYFAPDVDATVMVKTYARGDANGDGAVNVGDIVTVTNYILALDPDPFVFSAADVDENGSIDVGDLVGIVNILLGGF